MNLETLRAIVGTHQECAAAEPPCRSPDARDCISCIYKRIVHEWRFGWDARKSAQNFRERGFDFAFASLIFEGSTLERESVEDEAGNR